MKRFRIVGLCLVAAFAMSVVGAVSASAEGPHYFTCAKTKGKTVGKYTTAECNTEGAGKYERAAVTKTVKTKTKASNPKNVSLAPNEAGTALEAAASVECVTEANKGSIVAGVAKWKTTFTGCKITAGEIKASCQTIPSKGKTKEGVITTEELEGTLVNLEAGKKVGELVKAPGVTLANYECLAGAYKVDAIGAVLAEPSNEGKASKTGTVVAQKGGGLGQKNMYIEGAHTEAYGLEFWLEELDFGGCVAKLEKEDKLSKAAAEAACTGAGHGKSSKTPPITIISKSSGAAIEAKGFKEIEVPATQEGTSEIGYSLALGTEE